jgi:CDP-diacylglycerol--glycerol-3-phosphate 3-phosphatidyltransferase
MTLADKVTLARLVIAPLAVLAYLLLPVEHSLCFWVCGLLCGLAEYTDLADGRIARQRKEVSDFGKLADPFCDVIYRQAMFLAMLLPAGGVGWLVSASGGQAGLPGAESTQLSHLAGRQLVLALPGGGLGAGLIPWLPVMLMIQREIVAGALRAMAATRGLILAARTSGKIKAWMQGVVLIGVMAFPAVLWSRPPWVLDVAFWASWACAVVSVLSIIEYIYVNRATLRQLLERRTLV